MDSHSYLLIASTHILQPTIAILVCNDQGELAVALMKIVKGQSSVTETQNFPDPQVFIIFIDKSNAPNNVMPHPPTPGRVI